MSAGWKGIADAVLVEAGVVVVDGVASIPYRATDGALSRMRFRAPDRCWWGPGEGVQPFGLEQLPSPGSRYPRYCALLVAEGESDALAAREHFAAHEDDRAVHYFALGVPGARNFKPEWRAACEPFDLVYAIGDGDAAGRAFAWDVRSRVPWARPVVCPDGVDLRGLLQTDGLGPVLALLRSADAHAEAEYALLHAPDLETALTWSEEER